MSKRYAVIAALSVAVAANISAAAPQDLPSPGTRIVTVVPGARYEAGRIRRVLLGRGWRDAWNTPIEVPVLDLRTFDGGLTPEREGGGLETASLRFRSANGRVWAFRSLDKNPKKKLDPETAQGWIGDVIQEFVAGAHPCGALMVPPLLDAAGVLHSTPQLAVMPDDERLGEFRPLFGGMLGEIEERIEHSIPGADKRANTLELFQRLDERNDEHVDARDYLRERLVDLLIGDWDRHIDQYRWLRFGEKRERVWRAVPHDRDQAFGRIEGMFPSVIEYYGKPLASWGDTYPPIDKITFAARFTDRRFLVSLDRTEWEAVTADLVARLTDAVISDAVHKLPPAMYAQASAELERALRSRRDRLTEASNEYYRLLAHDVDVRGTTRDEDFDVERLSNGAVTVAIYARDEKSGERPAVPYFRRTFVPGETSEIRLYTMGGQDRVVERGNGTGDILLRVISPPATSELVDRSNQESSTKLYAPLPPPQIPPNQLAKELARDPQAEERVRYEVFRDWGRDYLFFPVLSYDATRGLFFGTYLQRTGYGFGLDPYASRQNFGAAFATGLTRPRIDYGAEFRTRSAVRFLVYAAYTGVEQAKFYGFGNETTRDSSLASNHYYDARQDQIILNPQLEVPLLGTLRARAGFEFKYAASVKDEANRLVGQVQPEGSNGMSVGSVQGALLVGDSSGTYPFRRAVGAAVLVRQAPSIFSNPHAFGSVGGAAQAVYGTHFLTNVEISERVSGQRLWGTYPFFEAAYLGGVSTRSPQDLTGATSGNVLRGYDINRFAGDAAFVSNTELTLEVGRWSSFLPLRYGVWGLCDVGRVFVDGQSSSKWHPAAGGGIWFGLFSSSPYVQLAGSFKMAMVSTDDGLSFFLESGFGL